MANRKEPQKLALLAAILLPLVLYWQCLAFDFVSFDDGNYTTQSALAKEGVTLPNLGKALVSDNKVYWQPLTHWTHMLDVSLFGLQHGGMHHLQNLVLHAGTSGLLYLLLTTMGAESWLALLGALLFSLHPLRVESVAWVAERKDLLAGFFYLLAVVLQARKAKESWFWMAAAAAYAAKPSAVTLPLTLACYAWLVERRPLAGLWRERRLMGLVVASAAVTLGTVVSQQKAGATEAIAGLTPWLRVQTALLSYTKYFELTLYPHGHSVLYPYVREVPWGYLAAGVAGLAAVSAWLWRRKDGWALFGWAWFLVALLPNCGLVQAGYQAYADRFTYIAAMGLAVVLVRVVPSGAGWVRPGLGLAAVVAAYASHVQIDTWRNSESLYRAALQQHPDNLVVLANLGSYLNDQNRPTEAIPHLRRATELDPKMHISQYNLARSYMMRQECGLAEPRAAQAARLRPDLADSVYLHALSLSCLGRSAEAIPQFAKALAAGLGPTLQPFAHQNIAAHAIRTLDFARARAAVAEGRRIAPGRPEWDQLAAQIPAER